jgi:cytochrome c oxidase subunit 2
MDTLRPASDFADWEASIYWETIGWYSLILILVIVLIALVLAKYSTRRVTTTREPPVHVGEHLAIEAAWTVGPAGILLLIAFPAIVINFISQPNRPPANALHVQVIGHQWWWEFHYPTLGIITANEIHVPLNRPIYFTLNSADVIHSFWVPRLGGKRDMIPNHTNELILTPNQRGEYLGQCAEFCGLSHANMRIRVFVDDAPDFARWVKQQQLPSRLPAPGQANYSRTLSGMQIFEGAPCAACHQIRGISKGTIAPDLSHFGSRTTLAGCTLPNRLALVEAWIEDPEKLKPGAKMPAMALSPDQVSSVATYLESLR